MTVFVVENEECIERIYEESREFVILWDHVRLHGIPGDADEFISVIGMSDESALRIAKEIVASGIDPDKVAYGAMQTQLYLFPAVLDACRLSELPNEEPTKYFDSGINGLTESLRWRSSELCIIAGPYSSGKSLFGQILMQDWVVNVAHNFDEPGKPATALIYAFEDDIRNIREDVRRHCQTAQSGNMDALSRIFAVNVTPDRDRYVTDFIALIGQYRKRHNTRFFLLDPWNELDHQRHSRQSETEYVREVMKALRRAVAKFDVVVALVTHVSAEFVGNDGALKPFKLIHAFGSSQFAAKADRGFCVVRTKKFADDDHEQHMIVRSDKIKREDRWVVGKMGKFLEKNMGAKRTMAFVYAPSTHSLYFDLAASAAARDVWKD